MEVLPLILDQLQIQVRDFKWMGSPFSKTWIFPISKLHISKDQALLQPSNSKIAISSNEFSFPHSLTWIKCDDRNFIECKWRLSNQYPRLKFQEFKNAPLFSFQPRQSIHFQYYIPRSRCLLKSLPNHFHQWPGLYECLRHPRLLLQKYHCRKYGPFCFTRHWCHYFHPRHFPRSPQDSLFHSRPFEYTWNWFLWALLDIFWIPTLNNLFEF